MINFRPISALNLIPDAKASLYRSAALTRLTTDEIKFIVDELCIDYYIDLRTTEEVLEKGKPQELIEAGVQWQSFPIRDSNHYFRSKPFPTFEDYFDSYKCLLEQNKSQFREIFLFLSTNHTKKFIFSCFAGKDRTGLLVILIMMLLKFSPELIANEYAASGQSLKDNINYFEQNWLKKGWTKNHYLKRLEPHPKAALLVIEYIEKIYGNVEGYLSNIGISAQEKIEQLYDLKKNYSLS